MTGHQAFRLSEGGSIDRSRPLSFTWEGRSYAGYAGDTLASALLANGVRVVGRSFKYHRPRGILAAGAEEPNALVQLGTGSRNTPNVRATEVALYPGLVAGPVNCWPSSGFDVGGVNNLMSRFLPAGFYYKTFMWPHWHLFEGVIRRAAGMGRMPKEADPDRYESRFAHCDVLVVGAGPAGLASALAAVRSGARVILVEQDREVGGALLFDAATIGGAPASGWIERSKREFLNHPEAKLLLDTVAIGYHDHNSLTLVQQVGDEAQCAADPNLARYRTWLVRAKRVVLATGSIERPLVFSGNDRPGIMLASAARHYVRRYAVLPGRRNVVFTNNDDAYATAFAIDDAGAKVVSVVDTRSYPASRLGEELAARGIRHVCGGRVVATAGAKGLKSVTVTSAVGTERIECDHLSMSGGFNPTVHLFSQSGGTLRFEEAAGAFVPDRSVQAERSVGTAAGTMDLGDILPEAHLAGAAAAAAAGFPLGEGEAPPAASSGTGAMIEPIWEVEGGRGKAFVDFQNDVGVGDIELSALENFRSVEHLKRYTTLGMACDQGKTSNVNALAIMGRLTGRTVEQTGHTRYRFPYVPVALGALGGRNRGELFRPRRRMPAHVCHVAAGAVFDDFGGWCRPTGYPVAGEDGKRTEQREALAVRTRAGLFEGSPLGKIEVVGRDAGRFLDLVYANTMSTLKPGRARYGLMLNELGVVLDDGIAARVDEGRFLVGTSSAGAERMLGWMEEWLQCEWLDLDVVLAPVTTAWAVITLTGPASKAILEAAGTSLDLKAFPHMSFASCEVSGIPSRVFRVSYTGERSYEINVPTREAEVLWRALMLAGKPHGLVPVGIDAWDALRTEKGYLHVGADTDGTTTALDLGWDHVVKKSCDFIGKRSLLRVNDQRADRLQFIGLAVAEGEQKLPIGAHIIVEAEGGLRSEGYVTSSADSAVLPRPVALGMLRSGRARLGERVLLRDAGNQRHAVVVDPASYDPKGERLND